MYLSVKVIPQSTRTECLEIMGDGTLKIRVNAAPKRGAANEELIRFLAKSCGISRDEIKIISGHSSPRKLIKIPDGTGLPW